MNGPWPLAVVGTLVLVALHAAHAPAVLAHDGGPHAVLDAWRWEPLLLLTLVLAWYARGTQALWRRAGSGRGVRRCAGSGRGVRRWQLASFTTGLVALLIALASPLDTLAASALWAHMGQHVLLMLVASPLLVAGAPLLPLLAALPEAPRKVLGRTWRCTSPLRLPVVAWLLHAAALWTWHIPSLYQAALRSEVVHIAEHASFGGTAALYWWTVLRPRGATRQGYALGVLSLFSMALQSGALGALMAFAQTPWYPSYAGGAAAWSMTPLEDQQLAALIMWIPGGFVYLIAALVLLGLSLRVDGQVAARPPGTESVGARP
jgi:putative membrane protein